MWERSSRSQKKRGCDVLIPRSPSDPIKWSISMIFPWTLATWRNESSSFTRWPAMKIYLDNVRATKERERKGKESLFKSGRKNPLGISDLLRVQLDVSNEWPVAIAVWEKLCSNRSSDVVGRVGVLRDALRCPYTWTTLPLDIDIPCCPVRFRKLEQRTIVPPSQSTNRGVISLRPRAANQPSDRRKGIFFKHYYWKFCRRIKSAKL